MSLLVLGLNGDVPWEPISKKYKVIIPWLSQGMIFCHNFFPRDTPKKKNMVTHPPHTAEEVIIPINIPKNKEDINSSCKNFMVSPFSCYPYMGSLTERKTISNHIIILDLT